MQKFPNYNTSEQVMKDSYCPIIMKLNKYMKFHLQRSTLYQIMKITFCQILLAMILSGICYSSPVNAQGVLDKQISISIKNKSIDKVLTYLKETYNIDFIYSKNGVDLSPIVTVEAKDRVLKEILDDFLKNSSIDYEVIKNRIVLTRSADKIETTSEQADIHLSGVVKDQNGQPLIGASVIEKGTANGITTDVNGNFKISVKSTASVLLIKYIGFQTQEITVDERRSLTITLTENPSNLDEVVVVGYGTRARKDVTGAIASINEKTLREVPVTNAPQLLQGRIAGAYVTSGSNKPGSTPSVAIRGVRSFQATNDPLYVIDGIPTTDAFNDINPNDIVSIDVLKDASATAIYGSRGANGVIIVTTARGKSGQMNVNYNTYFGVTHVTRHAEYFNGPEFVEYKRDAYRKKGTYNDADPVASDALIFNDIELNAIADGIYTDWPELITSNGFTQNHELSILGGAEKTRYNLSLGFFDDKGYFKIQDYRRYNARINLDQDIGTRVKAGISMLGSYSERNGGSINPYYGALIQSPIGSPYGEAGNLVLFPTGDVTMGNPLAAFQRDKYINREERFRLLSSIYAEAEILKGLKLRVNFGPDLSNSRTGNFNSTRLSLTPAELPTASTTEGFLFSYTLENIVSYERTFAEKHKLDFTGLYSIQERKNKTSSISVRDLPVETVSYYNLGQGTVVGVGSGYEKWDILSYMGRINYSYDSRFYLTLTTRADGSSRFAPGHKWGLFPSAVFAYNLSNEDFIKNAAYLSNLKLRVGWGKTGNPGIDPYATQGLISRTSYDFDGTPAFGYGPSSIPNQDLKWETTASTNIGLDFGLFKDRITGAIEAYNTITTDLLLNKTLPGSSGFQSVLSNVGSTQNRGLEISLSTRNIISRKGFQWSTDITSAFNKEKILELSLGKVDDLGSRRFIGEPLSVWFDYEKIGIWQLGEEALAAQFGSSVGQIKVADKNGNGKIDPDDRTILGAPRPTFTFGFNNRFTYKAFDLSVFVIGVSDKTIVSPFHELPNNTIAFGGRYNQLAVDYWTPTNPTNAYPEPIGDQGAQPGPVFGSSLKYFNGDFVRIRNINLGYNLPLEVASKIKAKSFRVFFNITNPYVFSSYVHKHGGIDPEILENPATVNYQMGLNVRF